MLRDTADSPTSRAGETSTFLGKYTTRVTPTSRVCPASVEPWRSFWGFFKAPTGGVTSGSTCDTVSEEMRQEEEGGVAPHELVEDKRRWKFDFACGLLPCVNISSHAAAETRQSVTAAPPATTEPLTLSLLVFSASPLAV